ncbi:MAG TPA: LysR family transcriptional regulator [Rhizobacter sp.]|nr:LysR family transcriptional regulator [Rhizobacter sp.]
MQHIKQLESFIAVARSKSIREAAETSHLTSSALNRRILDLEREVGSPLFERHARGINLTSAGEIYLAYAKRAVRDAETAGSQIDDLKGLRRGHIKLSVIAVLANDKLMETIAVFQQRFPQVAFSVTVAGSDEVVASVVSHQADLGMAFNLSLEKDFYEIAERRYVMCAVLRRDHPQARRRTISLNDCVNFPVALPDRSWGGRRLLDEYLSRSGFRLAPQLVSNSYEVLLAFVRRTHGVCFQIRPEKKGGKEADDLVAIPVTEMVPFARHLVLGCLRGRVLPVAAALFSEAARRSLFG